MVSGAESLVRALERAGASVVFGAVGPDNLPLVVQLRAQGVRFIATHTPQAAVSAANGFASRTGRFGVALTGPDASPLPVLHPLAEAKGVGAPILLLDVAPPAMHRRVRPGDSVATVGPSAALAEVSRGVHALRVTDDVHAVVKKARDLARKAPGGPVVLHVGDGFLSATVPGDPDEPDANTDPAPRPPPATVEHVQLRRAANLVDNSQNILIWVGGGALRAGAGGAVAELAEKVGAPVQTTIHAAGLLPARHPCLIGMPPHLPAVGALWDSADLVIAIGTDFDADATQGGQQPAPDSLIAINVDPVNAGRSYQPDVLLRGDARALTKALADTVQYRGGTAVVRSRLEEVRTSVRRQLEVSHSHELAFLAAVSAAIPDRATVVTDPCAAGRWLAAFHEWTLPRSLLFPDNLEAFGAALPTAIGAAAASSPEPVIAVIGDQGLLASLGELDVIVREKLAMTILVVDDDGAGRLRPLLDAHDQHPDSLDQTSPDFVALARTIGMRADTTSDVGEGLTEALKAHVAAPDPTMLVVRTRLSPPPTARHRWYRQTGRAL